MNTGGYADLGMLRIRVLGELEAVADADVVAAPESRRAWALLGWLALNPGQHSRSVVAAVLWPDVLDSSALQSLRSALWSLRRAVGPAASAVSPCRSNCSCFWVKASPERRPSA